MNEKVEIIKTQINTHFTNLMLISTGLSSVLFGVFWLLFRNELRFLAFFFIVIFSPSIIINWYLVYFLKYYKIERQFKKSERKAIFHYLFLFIIGIIGAIWLIFYIVELFLDGEYSETINVISALQFILFGIFLFINVKLRFKYLSTIF